MLLAMPVYPYTSAHKTLACPPIMGYGIGGYHGLFCKVRYLHLLLW